MKTYLVSTYWRGTMNVDNMRSFTDPVEAYKYWDSFGPNEDGKRMYEVSPDKSPKLLKEKDRKNYVL